MKFPTLTKMVKEMALFHDFKLLPQKQWQWPENAKELEFFAVRLTEEERKNLIGVGAQELLEATARTCSEALREDQALVLSDFLDSVFDGDLISSFCPQRL